MKPIRDYVPKRLLMTTDLTGGTWTYSMELCRGLGNHGVQVLLAAMGGTLSREQWEEVSKLPNVGVVCGQFKVEWMEDCWEDVAKAGKWLLGLERKFGPDVIHLNSFTHGSLPWNAPCLVAAHSCVASAWMAVNRTPLPSHWQRYATAVRRGLRDASVVVAPTQSMLDSLETLYASLPVTKVIPMGRDPVEFTTGPKEDFVLATGRIDDESKNIVTVMTAASGMSWPVVVAGECASPESLRPVIKNTRLLGRLGREEMAGLYARASIFVCPAHYEPAGLPVLEAALSGCALVLGDIPSMRELWNGVALFVSPNDQDALKYAVNSLIAHPTRRQQLGKKARDRASRMTAQRMVAAHLGTYGELMMQTALGVEQRVA
jgi:glycosyltransferase involved in cell wall biosynthesis